MAIAIKKSSAKPAGASSLNPAVQNQIASNIKLDTTDYTEKEEPKPKGKRTDDLVQLKFSRGKRAEAKAFYALHDLKMNTGFEIAYEFLKQEVNAGRVRLSRSGVERIGEGS